jgi:hypothetical protein
VGFSCEQVNKTHLVVVVVVVPLLQEGALLVLMMVLGVHLGADGGPAALLLRLLVGVDLG